MAPTLRSGQVVVCVSRADYAVGNIVVARVNDREVIKRVASVSGDAMYLTGDNSGASTDSRHYGSVGKRDILGVMKYTYPVRALDAPKLRHMYGRYFGWAAAAVMIGFAVLHMFRIDTFVPELQRALGWDRTAAAWLAGGIVCAEVFAVPFLLRMRLSVLAQYASGLLGVVVPLFWTLLAIGTYGSPASTAQLGEFVSLPSSPLVIVLNIVWLTGAYITLWALGYDYRPHEKQSFVTKLLSRLSK